MRVRSNVLYTAVRISKDTHDHIAGAVNGAKIVTDVEGRPRLKIADSLYDEGGWIILLPSKRSVGKFFVYEIVSDEVFETSYTKEAS